LNLGELAEIAILDPENDIPFDPNGQLFSPEAVLTYLPNLVTKLPHKRNKSTPSTIRFTHFSIQEYLLSQRIRQRPTKDFHIEEADAHLHIANSCLAYHLHLSRDILATKDTFQKFILWPYASRYWHEYIENLACESLPDTIKSRLAQLLDRRSRAFLNLYRISNRGYLRSSYTKFQETKWDLQLEQVCPPLFYCASLASLWPTRYLIENGENIDEVTDNGAGNNDFALQHAIREGSTKIVKFLLERGANPNIQGGWYGNALQAAAYRGSIEIVQLLFDRGAEITLQGGFYGNALQAAASDSNIEIVQLLLDRGADVNMQGGYYGNALQAAAYRGNAFRAAAYHGNTEIVQLLLDRGADVNFQGGYYGNALQAAASSRNPEIVQLLLDRGADVNFQGGQYENALQAAAYSDNIEIVQLLLDRGADVNARDGRYGNAVQAAVVNKTYDVAKLLHSRGAEVDPPGPEWEEMLSRESKQYGSEAKVGRLKEFQADPAGFLAKKVL
jgi:ankyrin repeat protein